MAMVADSLSMNHQGMKFSLISRELMADGIEAVVRGHSFDAFIGIAGCDKSLPGILMGMARCNLPSVFLYGGSTLPGRYQNRDVTVLDVYEAVGASIEGKITKSDLDELEHCAIPTLGSCPGQFTANTMAMVAETLGFALPGVATMPAVYSAREGLARENARLNGVAPFLTCIQAAGLTDRRLRARAPFDLVFANILLAPLRRLARPMRPLLAPGSHVVLSGLLAEQETSALAAHRPHGLTLVRRIPLGEWVTLVLAL